MRPHKIDFEEVRKAMEDVERDAFDYFLDNVTGEVLILSGDILARAEALLSENYEDDTAEYESVELDEDLDLPEWAEDEVELALDIFINRHSRYRRIPERRSDSVFRAMREFAAEIENPELRQLIEGILEGKGAFRRFKDALEHYPKERKQWYGYSARMARQEILEWLGSEDATQAAEAADSTGENLKAD